MRLNRLARAGGAALLLLAAPGAAFGVSVSSSDGSGTQVRQVSYNNGAYVSGYIKSSVTGQAVYYSGKVIWNEWYCTNTVVGGDTAVSALTSSHWVGGYITAIPGGCSAQGVQLRVCRDIQFQPDSCGYWSAKY